MQPINILIGIFVTRTLGPESKGIYTYAIIVSALFVPIFLLGFNAGMRYHIIKGKYSSTESFFSAQIVGIINGISLSMLVFFLWNYNLLGVTGNALDRSYLYIILIIIPFSSLNLIIDSVLKANSLFRVINFNQILNGIISGLSLIFFVFFLDLGLEGAFYSILTIKALYVLILIIYVNTLLKTRITLNIPFIKDSYHYGFRTWLGTIANQANAKLDHFLLSLFADSQILGLYTVAYNYSSLFTQPINGILPVLFNKIAITKDKGERKRITEQVHRSMLWVTLPLSVFMALISQWLIPFIYGAEFYDSFRVVQLLVPGVLSYLVTRRCIDKYLGASGMPEKSSYVQMTAAIIGLLLFVVLIPSYGMLGAAVGTSLSFIISTFQAYYYYKSDIKPDSASLFKLNLNDLTWVSTRIRGLLKGQKGNNS